MAAPAPAFDREKKPEVQTPNPQDFEKEFGDRAKSPGFERASKALDAADSKTQNLKNLERGATNKTINHGESGSSGDGGSSDGKSLSSDQLKDAENDQLGEGYRPDKSKKNKVSIGQRLASKAFRKKAFVGGGAGIGIVSLCVIGFLALIPLKLEHIVDNLQSHFFASTENAVQDESASLLKDYFKTILPSYRSCGININKGCSENITGNSPIDNLYRSWHNAKLENILSSKFGIELQYNSATKTYLLKAPGTAAGGDVIGKVDADGKDDFSALDTEFDSFASSSRTEIRQTINNALSTETKWKQVLYRYKIGRLLEEKYGIKRCIVACTSVRDPLADKVAEKKVAMQLWLVQRVTTPRTQSVTVVLGCILSSACDTTETPSITADGECTDFCEGNGAPVSPATSEIREKLDTYAASLGVTDAAAIDKMVTDLNTITEQGYSTYAISKALSAIGLDDLSESVAENGVPFLGWVSTFSSLIHTFSDLGTKTKVLAYTVNASAAVDLAMMYLTYSDEIKTGSADPTEVGSFINALGPGDHSNTVDACTATVTTNCSSPSTDPEVGGTGGAEGSPLYQSIMGDSSATTSTQTAQAASPSLFSKLTSTALALSGTPTSTSATDELCAPASSGATPTGPTNGALICPEDKLGDNGNATLTSIQKQLNTAPLSFVTQISDKIHGFTSLFSDLVGSIFSVVSKIPGLSDLLKGVGDLFSVVIKPFETFLVSSLIPNPFGTNMSGSRTFVEMAGGFDAANSTEAENGLGGVDLTPVQTSEITNEQEQQTQSDFNSQPLLAKIFNTSSPYSLISRFADTIPTTAVSLESSILSVLSNPFKTISSNIGSMVSGKAFADTPAAPDPFDVTQYGYPAGSIPTDPETYWNQNCADSTNVAAGKMTLAYNAAAAAAVDPNTGGPYNQQTSAPGNGTDPCLLIQAAVGSAGAIYNENLLTPDDLADTPGANTSSPSSTNNNIYVIGDDLAQGMDNSLSSDLSGTGWDVVGVDGTPGEDVAGGITKLNTDASEVSTAGTILIELGANNCDFSPYSLPTCPTTAQFYTQIENMINAVRAINSSAQIYWMNVYTTLGPVYDSINQALSDESTSLNFKIIDWANEAATNSSQYSFDDTGAFLTSPSSYQTLSTFVTSQIGTPSNQTASTGPNLVAQAILGTQTSGDEFIASIAHFFGKIMSSIRPVESLRLNRVL